MYALLKKCLHNSTKYFVHKLLYEGNVKNQNKNFAVALNSQFFLKLVQWQPLTKLQNPTGFGLHIPASTQ